MPKRIIDLAEFHKRLSDRRKVPAGTAVRLANSPQPAVVDGRVIRFVISNGRVDRYGDTIDVRGWILDNYLKAPRVLLDHVASVDNVIGRAVSVFVDGNDLVADLEFMDGNEKAEDAFQKIKNGWLNTVSVGFQPLEWALSKDKNRPGGIDFRKQELLEISVVAIPANPDAMSKNAGADNRLQFTVGPDATSRVVPAVSKKGLYSVGSLADLLEFLGYLQESSAWEAEYEGDGSEVPQMLLDAMKQLGAALVAMTIEEVGELLAGKDDADPVIVVDDDVIMESLTPSQKAFLAIARNLRVAASEMDVIIAARAILERGLGPVAKAGKVLSSSNEKTLRDAHEMITKGCTMIKDMVDAAADSGTADDNADEARAARIRLAEALRLDAA